MVDLRGFIDSKECWNSMFWTSVLHGQPVGSDKKPKTNISTIIADIWTKFDLCIDRGEARGGLLFSKIVGYHIPCWINLYECIDYIYYRNEFSVTGVLVRVGNENIIFPWNSVSKMTVVSNSASYQLNVINKLEGFSMVVYHMWSRVYTVYLPVDKIRPLQYQTFILDTSLSYGNGIRSHIYRDHHTH